MKRIISFVVMISLVCAFLGTSIYASETETETEFSGLQPKEVTGDTRLIAQYPTIERQVEQQLSMLSRLSFEDIENMIRSYDRQINYSIKFIADSMMDTSNLTVYDDATMAMVKMLRNVQSVREFCGDFNGITEYTANLTDQILTMELVPNYSQAEEDNTMVSVRFIYDLARNVTLLVWELNNEDLFGVDGLSGSDDTTDSNIWAQIESLNERVNALERQSDEPTETDSYMDSTESSIQVSHEENDNKAEEENRDS